MVHWLEPAPTRVTLIPHAARSFAPRDSRAATVAADRDYVLAAIFVNLSNTSRCSGKRPVWCLLQICVPLTCTSKMLPPPSISLVSALNSLLIASAKLAAFGSVSHCYRRNPTANWPYNLYTMVHAGNKEACRRITAQMADSVGVHSYELLFSRRELKKTSMKYFSP